MNIILHSYRRTNGTYSTDFWDLYEKRYEAGNGERIDKALHAIEEANGSKLKNVFQDISFNTDRLGQEKQKLSNRIDQTHACDRVKVCDKHIR